MTPSDLAFETPRVKARLLCEDDLDLYLALYTDPEVMRHVGGVLPLEQVHDFFGKVVASNRRRNGRGRYWGIRHLRSGEWLGQASLMREATDATRAEVGIMLLSSAQHLGIGLQVLQAMVRMALEGNIWPDVRELVARHAAGNEGAGRLVSHLGFRRRDPSSGFVCWSLRAGHEEA